MVGSSWHQAKRLKELEKENCQLKRLIAGLSLDNAILKEAYPRNLYISPQPAISPGFIGRNVLRKART